MDVYKRLEALSQEEYERALRAVLPKMTTAQRKMLAAHAGAPEASISMTELGEAAGYASHQMANIQYGRLGRRLGEYLGTNAVQQQIQNMAWASKEDGEHWHWTLHPAFLSAIRAIGVSRILTDISGGRDDAAPVANSNAPTERSEDELRASVSAYLDMLKCQAEGRSYVKKDVYRGLAGRFGRTEKAFEYRMQNISYVMSLLGREWVSGLLPARNVGGDVAVRIERLIAELEQRESVATVEDEIRVRRLRLESGMAKPTGAASPARASRLASGYARDPAVKAWVLRRANGKCESCGEDAPFLDTDELPFLEVHHVRHLADGGSDRVTNAVALCPNCHRRLHFSLDRKISRERLYARVKELLRE